MRLVLEKKLHLDLVKFQDYQIGKSILVQNFITRWPLTESQLKLYIF